MIHDLRFALRLLWKDRGFAATAILTLAVCIGANTAIFTIVNSVLLRPLPVPESNRIMLMANEYPNAASDAFTNSGVPDYYDRLRDVHVFEEQAMFDSADQSVEIEGTSERIHGMAATPSFFRLLRVQPVQGRAFEEAEGELGNEQKVILSFGLWQQLYGADTQVIGREIRFSGRAYTVVGIMPRDFSFFDPEVRFWMPLAFTPQQKSDDERHSNSWYNIGRLKKEATREQAQAQIDALNAANLERFVQFKEILVNAGFRTAVEPLQDVMTRSVTGTLYLLWGGAVFVLLIGGVNIANLALARSSLRVKELATRLALGARRVHVARQLTVEGILLAAAGGIGGLLFGFWILRALGSIGLGQLPRANEIHMDGSVAVFASLLSLIVGCLIGLMSIAQLFRIDLNTVLREEGRTGTSGRKAVLVRRSLVVAQVAFAFILLIGAGLLFASFRSLLSVDPGFEADGVMTALATLPNTRYPDDNAARDFAARALAAIRRIPGVTAAGATTNIPLSGYHSDSVIVAEGYQMQPGESIVSPTQVRVTPGYFEAMNTPLVQGRYFDEHDNENAPGVVIVDQRLARKFWPGGNPVGKRMYKPERPEEVLKPDAKTRRLTVVGVVQNVQLDDLAAGDRLIGAYYFPFAQDPPRSLAFAFKTSSDSARITTAVRRELAGIDVELPLFSVRTMAERIDSSLVSRKAAMLLAISFGCVALFLSAVGIYGVLAYLVAQRTREIGIRIALGSTAGGIFKLVLREGVVLVMGGLVLGLLGTIALRQTLEAQIYGIGALDPLVIGAVIVTLGAIALIACALPARRAMTVDPAVILSQ